MRITNYTYSYYKSLLRALTLYKVWNFFLLKLSFYLSRIFRRAIHWGRPAFLSAEPTTVCNLGCPECPSGLKAFSRPTGSMDLDMFDKLISQTKDHLIYLILYFQGEPYLNPFFGEMVKRARANKIVTATSTNGHYLTERYAKVTVESGLDELIISLDGLDQETYSRYRRGGDLNKVLQGIKTLVKVRKEMNASHPLIHLQFIVMKHNEHQIQDFLRLAKDLGVDLPVLKSAQIYSENDQNSILPESNKKKRYYKDDNGMLHHITPLRKRCWRMWHGAVITWDGRMVPCCYDKDASHQMGSLDSQSLEEIWRNERYHSFRNTILKERESIEICRNCGE